MNRSGVREHSEILMKIFSEPEGTGALLKAPSSLQTSPVSDKKDQGYCFHMQIKKMIAGMLPKDESYKANLVSDRKQFVVLWIKHLLEVRMLEQFFLTYHNLENMIGKSL